MLNRAKGLHTRAGELGLVLFVALACVVPRATKPPSSNSEMIKCFMTVLLELWLSQNLHRKGNQAKSLSKWTESLRPRYLARSAPTRTALCVA